MNTKEKNIILIKYLMKDKSIKEISEILKIKLEIVEKYSKEIKEEKHSELLEAVKKRAFGQTVKESSIMKRTNVYDEIMYKDQKIVNKNIPPDLTALKMYMMMTEEKQEEIEEETNLTNDEIDKKLDSML